MNNHFKRLKYPDYEELKKSILDHPENAPLLCLRFILSCMIIDEFNQLRDEQTCLSAEQRKSYDQTGFHEHKFRIEEGKLILKVPRLRAHQFHPKALDIAEKLHGRYIQKIPQEYISGESDRDIAENYSSNGNPISRSTVSRYFQAGQEAKISAFLNHNFKNEPYLDLQLDALYAKCRVPGLEKDRYVNQAQIRVLGLSAKTGHWEVLSLMVLPGESEIGYRLVCEDLVNRHIGPVYLATCDLHKSFKPAVLSSLVGVQIQYCRFHHQNNVLRRASKEESPDLKDFFEAVYGNTAGVEAAFSQKENCLAGFDLSQKALESFNRHFKDTLSQKDYPKALASQISTTNQTERSNEEDRRRLDPRHLSPNSRSLERISYSVTEHADRHWYQKQAVPDDALSLSAVVHDSFLGLLYQKACGCLKEYPEFYSQAVPDVECQALWCHLLVVPVELNGRVMTLGFAAIFGVDMNRKTRLLQLEPVKSSQEPELAGVWQKIRARGLDSRKLGVVIQNTNLDPFISSLEQAFKDTPVFTNPDLIMEDLVYLVPSEFKDPVRDKLLGLYQAATIGEARLRQEELADYFDRYGLSSALTLFKKVSESDRLINIFKIIGSGRWL